MNLHRARLLSVANFPNSRFDFLFSMMGFQNTILALNGCEVLVNYRSKV